MINRLKQALTISDLIRDGAKFIGTDSPEIKPIFDNTHELRVQDLNSDLYQGLQSDVVSLIRNKDTNFKKSIQLLETKHLEIFSNNLEQSINQFKSIVEPSLVNQAIKLNNSNTDDRTFRLFNMSIEKTAPALAKMLASVNLLLNFTDTGLKIFPSELVEMQGKYSEHKVKEVFDKIFVSAQRSKDLQTKEKLLAYALAFYYLHENVLQARHKTNS